VPVSLSSIYKTREDILNAMISQLVAVIPDAYVGTDGVIRIIFDIEAGQFESLYLAEQLLLEDMFVSTASYQALQRYGDQYGLPMMLGTRATGTVMFSGADGIFIPQGSLVAYDTGSGVDPVYFETTADVTTPAPGNPIAPIPTTTAGAGNLTGAYEYVVTFLTAQGETLPSPDSSILNVTAGQINVTAIPLGGPQTTGRKLYRQVNGTGNYRLVQTFNNNTTTSFIDNVSDASIATAAIPPTVDTAHRIPAQATAQDVGANGNVVAGAITILSDVPAQLTAVTNPNPFTGGSDPEDVEAYRARLLDFIQNPQTGSVSDIQAWALNVPGVETATVFENTPSAGTVTVRITGPGGTIATPDVISAVQASLDALDYANITIVVSSFTALATNVTVDVTTTPDYTLASVTPSVQQAVSDYINNLETGATMYLSGIVDAVFGLTGIIDVTVTTPTTNQTTPAGSKRTTGTITVT